ncbi:hypothetical protein KR054_001436, partial [Drosophila jambulina]
LLQLEELDSERLNELESILYASIHYSDGGGEQGAADQLMLEKQPPNDQDADARSMPPPSMQQKNPPPGQQSSQRFVSETRVINNQGRPKPRYWTEETEGQVKGPEKEQQAIPNKTNQGEQHQQNTQTKQHQNQQTNKQQQNQAQKQQQKQLQKQQQNQQQKQQQNQHQKQQQNQQQKQQQNNQKPKQQPQNQQTKQQPKEKPSPHQSPVVQKPKGQATNTATKTNHEAYEEERFDQRLLVAIPPNCTPKKQNKQQQQQQGKQQNKQQQNKQQQQSGPGPFGKANRKLEQMQRLAAKKQKSKQAQANKKQRKALNAAPVDFVDLAESDNGSSSDDDVVLVPLPPVPVIDLDASDNEQPSTSSAAAAATASEVYHEENAMDAADVTMGLSCITEPATGIVTPSMHSPCSSVMSSDDFIVQKDTSRLLAEREKANDDDLLVLTENAIREAEIDQEKQGNVVEEAAADLEMNPQNQDTSSEYEFVPPSRLDEIKQNYRVDDEQQFRALDVYESESDLTESGIYSKAKPKVTPTIIRSVESPSEESVEEVVEPSVQKMKRLRKRSFSANNHSQSESANNEDGENDSDSDDGVHSTGVPGIARGMAVERCKRKIRRISTRRSSEENPRKAARSKKPMQSLSQEASSESAAEDELPSAREIAERLLKQEQGLAREQPSSSDAHETVSIGSDADSQGEAEFRDAMTDRIAAVFERIEAHSRKSAVHAEELDASGYISDEEEDSRDKIVDSTVEESVEVANELQEADPDENDVDVTIEEPQIQVERNLPGITDDESLPSGGELIGWNEEMRRFYDDSWQGEHFSVHKLHRAMSAHRQEWRINNADRYPVMRPRSHAKCTNCAEMGHVRSKCPRPRKPPICFMCGVTGHAEPRCPNAICFGCGSKQAIYVQQCNKCSFHSRLVCQLCKMRGHGTDQCPDKWRRYHSTTRSNVELDSRVQYKLRQCSFCAGRGHLFENCRQRIGDFRSNNYSSQIVSHQKVYKDRSGPLGDLGDLSSFYALETPFHFQWSIQQMPKNSYYSRFLVKVDLARPQAVKRKSTTAVMEMPAKVYFAHDYVPNAQARAARGEVSAAVESPEQQKENPVVGEEEANKEASVDNEAAQEAPVEDVQPPADEDDAASIQREEITSNSQTQDAEEPITTRPPVASHELDSDSNYSFSEHFEVPSSTTTEDRADSDHPLANLPDIIPLSGSLDDDFEVSSNSQGISMCVNASKSSNRQQTEDAEKAREIPCEGKIIMARDQSEYLFSPEGRTFLAETAKQCQVSVRMDFKDYGYVLVIYGLKEHQENLQLKLLRRHQEVKRKSIEFQSQKPPKRIDVLIRFLRDGINSLSSNLGNAKSHYMRIKALEEMNTKNGYKMAEKKRRQLNMILVGQAGLLNGNTHLDQLLVLLRRLVDEFSPDENATPEMRNEIEEHWRMIFTAYPHPNYDSLINSYGRLDQKNRLPSLHLDPVLLGLQTKKAPPSPAKRAPSPAKRAASPTPPPPPAWRMAPPPPPLPKMPKKKQRQALLLQQQTQQQQQLQNMMRQNQDQQQQLQDMIQQQQNNQQQQRLQRQQQQQQRLQQNQQQQHMVHQQQNHQQQQRMQQQQHNKLQQQQQQHQLRRQQSTYVMPFNNPQQRSRADLQLRQTLNPECVNLLAEMERNERGGSINKDANKPSMFWSRESLKYLNDLFKMTSNSDTVERLNRVLQRSQRGQLSHNDYRAVIKLHTLLLN